MRRLGLALMAAIGCAAGCNGDDDGSSSNASGGSCGAFHACGGDIVGTWQVDSVCFDDLEALFASQLDEDACADVFRGAEVDASGTYEFGADGVGNTDFSISISMNMRWTEACVSAVNGGANIDIAQFCPQLEATYMSQGQFEGAACMLAGGACDCMLTSVPMSRTSAGAYSIDGDKVIDAQDGDGSPFCVSGDTLAIRVTTDSLSGTISLSR